MMGLGMSADLVHEDTLSVGFREVAQQITSLFGQAIAGARLEAVSYPHLDVYKRQVLR